jgi:ABC-2 type transport system permease protein
MSKLLVLSHALWRGFVRDRASLFFSLVIPLIFLVLFGGVFNFGTSRTSVIEIGRVPIISAQIRHEYASVLEIKHYGSASKALAAVRNGDYVAAITQRGNRIAVQYTKTDAVEAGTVQGVLAAVIGQQNQAASGSPPRYRLTFQSVEDTSLKQIQYVLPGLLGWAVATSGTFGAAMSLVVWRRSRLLRRLQLAPIPTSAIVTARVVVSIGIAIVQAAIFVGLGKVAFGLQLTHDWWMALPIVVCATLAFLSIGLVAGAISRTEEATAALVNVVILPMAFLSGSFIPLAAAPGWIRAVSHLLPLTHANNAMLDTMVRGKSWTAALPDIGVLLGFAVVFTVIATQFFNWKTDVD